MLTRALNYLGAVAIACIVGLATLGAIAGDQSQAENTLSTVLVMSVTAIAALVAPTGPRS